LDVLAAYWLLISLMLQLGVLVMFISSLDDCVVDLGYWIWRLRHPGRWQRSEAMPEFADDLYQDEQQPIALMIPAWQEAAVIARMADYAARNFDYDNYHIFIGTYPNDPATQAEVDKVVQRYPNVHKVVTSQPGPTTKADCLNHIVAFILQMEAREQIHFSCACYHDAEDVIHPLELRAFNHLIPRYDLVQLPVLPLLRPFPHWLGNHYADEFAEFHGKDVLMRQRMSGQVPSAGVGTAFSRKALNQLSELQAGRVFDTQSLTEDYEIGFRLHAMGKRALLLHYPVRFRDRPPAWFGRPDVHAQICVQEFFPDQAWATVRQKSRWMVGIVFQAWRNLGWQGSWRLRYWLMRDRKGVLAFPTLLAAYLIVIHMLLAWAQRSLYPEGWRFPDLIPQSSWLWSLVAMNFLFMCNRILQRLIFTARYYGWGQALQSLPRMVLGNLINIAAFFRALTQSGRSWRNGRAVRWDKTEHQFPDLPSGQ